MRPSWTLLFVPLLLAALASGSGGPSLRRDGAAAAVAAVEDRREHHGGGGHHAAPGAEGDAFYLKVGRFAVMVHSMWHGIKPVPRLERVVSASTRPAAGGGVDYLLVLRVAPPLGTCRALVWGVPGEGSKNWKLKYLESVVGA
ncbi:hypothetical protein SEVIR_9G258200v4 [Setaria viridis]|uniref:Cysteine proteinase inhibitor n=2 Tax=Setaria TaxID=4554 RepID=K4AM95_SETIT|nr:hypothetical protein SETIT_9G255900v2 [Setaria italica]TKV93877.1 hypothetical protein SEVIR_9G258200v2 [Setaria viridis]